MSWISIVLWVLTHAPDIINIVKEILSLIHPSQLSGLKSAVEAGIQNNDVGAVRKAFQDLRGSIGAAPELVKC